MAGRRTPNDPQPHEPLASKLQEQSQGQPQETRPPEKVHFYEWFEQLLSRDGRVKPGHMAGIQAAFHAENISDKETAETYEAALKRYGL